MAIEIRIAEEAHINALGEIERAAARRFSDFDVPAHLRNQTIPKQILLDAQKAGLLLVALEAGKKPVGFASTQKVGPDLHLVELDVHPDYQRQGVGAALMKSVDGLAQDHGCRAVTLTTFRHVAWNAPWYERQGFKILQKDEIPAYLRIILEKEKTKGLDPAQRVAMKKQLDIV